MSYKYPFTFLVVLSLLLIVNCDNNELVHNNDYNDEALYNTWQFSKSNSDTLIFVPEGYEQASILPAITFTFYKDNKFIENSFDPADAPIQFTGIWKLINNNHILISFDENQANRPQNYEIEIIELKEHILRVIKNNN